MPLGLCDLGEENPTEEEIGELKEYAGGIVTVNDVTVKLDISIPEKTYNILYNVYGSRSGILTDANEEGVKINDLFIPFFLYDENPEKRGESHFFDAIFLIHHEVKDIGPGNDPDFSLEYALLEGDIAHQCVVSANDDMILYHRLLHAVGKFRREDHIIATFVPEKVAQRLNLWKEYELGECVNEAPNKAPKKKGVIIEESEQYGNGERTNKLYVAGDCVAFDSWLVTPDDADNWHRSGLFSVDEYKKGIQKLKGVGECLIKGADLPGCHSHTLSLRNVSKGIEVKYPGNPTIYFHCDASKLDPDR